MSQYILLNRIKVQNANAIAGFTWGFPAITHFLGFSHNLSRKLANSNFKDFSLSGCGVIAHNHHVHTYGGYDKQFTQTRNPPYLKSHDKKSTPPVIEEGKMNMTVSLLIKCEGNIGNRQDDFTQWLENTCLLQRLAGGTILEIKSVEVFGLNDENLRSIKRKLLPGFVLLDRSEYLKEQYQNLQKQDNDAELFDAWLDFIALKQKARPESNLIAKHFEKMSKEDVSCQLWQEHLKTEYQQENISSELQQYFDNIEDSKSNKKLLQQWQEYNNPSEKTKADWEYLPKPEQGYLVPIMTGYKAISEVYKNHEVQNTRDHETDVCFVESVHSIGEWRSVHRFDVEKFEQSLWNYHYEDNWYLCKQKQVSLSDETTTEESSDDF